MAWRRKTKDEPRRHHCSSNAGNVMYFPPAPHPQVQVDPQPAQVPLSQGLGRSEVGGKVGDSLATITSIKFRFRKMHRKFSTDRELIFAVSLH